MGDAVSKGTLAETQAWGFSQSSLRKLASIASELVSRKFKHPTQKLPLMNELCSLMAVSCLCVAIRVVAE